MIKAIFWLIISIVGILWMMGIKISFKTFSIKFNNWGEGLCILGLILCFTIACSINYNKGKKEGESGKTYSKGFKEGSDFVLTEFDRIVKEKKEKEELQGGRDFKKSDNDKTEVKHL